eukprot:TRINITY_DN20996_c0_g1_i2.p1 TRINITY_DN20996_c0_g1~~TRINITY_DN20996_c0_g1_i2.p1  ORF type:complete len:372 (-),score=59.35 TRINITY_DN20996_c0_g1_i2:287-1402(-)
MAGPSSSSDEPLTPLLAILATLKGMIGAGILGLPYVFSHVNLAIAVPGIVIIALINAAGVWQLVKTSVLLFGLEAYAPRGDSESDSSSESAEDFEQDLSPKAAPDDWGLGPSAQVGTQLLGSAGLVIAAVTTLGTQLGICLVYVDVVVDTAKDWRWVAENFSMLTQRIILLVIFCILSLVRELRTLAKLSGAALLVYVYLLAALVWFGTLELTRNESTPMKDRWLPMRWQNFGMFAGVSIFTFEGIVIAQYVFKDMKLRRPSLFKPVIQISYIVGCVLLLFVGAFGYMAYGRNVEKEFYLNFPSDSIAVTISEVVLVLVIVMSYMLQMYPVFTFLEAVMEHIMLGHQGHSLWAVFSDSDSEAVRCIKLLAR